MRLREVIEEAHRTAYKHGFWDERDRTTAILLIHTELAEAVQELRNGNRQKYLTELADTFIRLTDLMGYEELEEKDLNIDFIQIIKDKMTYNKTREYKHGKKF